MDNKPDTAKAFIEALNVLAEKQKIDKKKGRPRDAIKERQDLTSFSLVEILSSLYHNKIPSSFPSNPDLLVCMDHQLQNLPISTLKSTGNR
jgi:hypothetical protein